MAPDFHAKVWEFFHQTHWILLSFWWIDLVVYVSLFLFLCASILKEKHCFSKTDNLRVINSEFFLSFFLSRGKLSEFFVVLINFCGRNRIFGSLKWGRTSNLCRLLYLMPTIHTYLYYPIWIRKVSSVASSRIFLYNFT